MGYKYSYKEIRTLWKSENFSTSSSDSSILASWIFRSSSVFNNSVFLTSSSGFSFCMVAASNCITVIFFYSFSVCRDINFALGMSKMIFWWNIFFWPAGLVAEFLHTNITSEIYSNLVSCIHNLDLKLLFPTCPVSPALVVVKLTSVTMEKASGGISGLGFLVVRKRRNSSL